MARIFRDLVVFFLIIGILPSLTALSVSYAEAFPGLYSRTGPLNLLKFFAPALLVFVGIAYRAVSPLRTRRVFQGVGAAWVVGTFFTLLSAHRCGMPAAFLREWATITVGLLAGLAVLVLPSRSRNQVFVGWFSLVFMSAVLEVFSPSAIDWLYAHIFDPETRKGDIAETGMRVLTGVFGRQSLAKLMAWLPWLVLPLFERRVFWAWAGTAALSGWILSTSQRGPTFAAFAALVAFGIHRFFISRKKFVLGEMAGVLVIGLVALYLLVPREIVAPRVLHEIAQTDANSANALRVSNGNADFRKNMTRASLHAIVEYPLGNACLSDAYFEPYGIHLAAHSHNLMLEQFRSRGWLWGLLHLTLWLLAGIGLWRSADLRSSAFFAAWVAVMVSGLVDHPWFVLNQAIVLGTILVAGLAALAHSNIESERT
jgi:hypothetical protein